MAYSEVYTRINWQNDPDTSTPLDADNLNAMDAALKTIDTRVVNIGNDAVYPSDIENALYGQPTLDQTTGIFTFPKKGGGAYTLDTMLEKVIVNFDWDVTTQTLTITLEDGSTKVVDLSALIKETEFTDSSNIAFTVVNHNVTAVVKDHSIGDQQMVTSYKADCEAAKDDAEDAADDAAASATAASGSAEDSEAWAVGTRSGTPVPSTDPAYHNSAKWHAEHIGSLGDLSDVNFSQLANGDVVKYDSATGKWINGQGSVVGDLDDLADVDLTNLVDGQTIRYNSTTQKWENSNAAASADIVALREVSPAESPHAVGTYLTYNNVIYSVIAAISIGNTLTVGTNIAVANIPDGASVYYEDDSAPGPGGSISADDVSYDNTDSGLTATNVKGAIDELAASGRGGGTNPNLLINPWFTVNQRGFTSGAGNAGTFIVDRWAASYGGSPATFSVSSSGITVTVSGGSTSGILYQKMENQAQLDGETVTMSVMFSDGSIVSGTVNSFDHTTQNAFYNSEEIELNAYPSGSFNISIKTTKTIRAAKLEIGSIPTLHFDNAPDNITELVKCQRYFKRFNFPNNNCIFSIGTATSTSYARFAFPSDLPMRAQPTCSTGGSFRLGIGSNNYSISSISVDGASSTQILSINVQGSGFTTGAICLLISNSAGAYIDFSAEL